MTFSLKSVSKVRKAALVCMFVYNAAVLIGSYIADVSIYWRTWILPILLIWAACLTAILDRLCNDVLRKDVKGNVSAKQCRYAFWMTFAVTFGILAAYYYAFFPGAYSPDSNGQLNEAVTGVYSDWHPFIHTFLFFTLPMQIFCAEEMIVFLQLSYFALGFAYLMMTVRKYGCPKWLCIVGVLWVVLAPVTGNIMMFPWKDCGMAIFSTVSVAHYIHIIMTKAKWLEKKWNILACSVFWTLTFLVRHNAVLFVFPMAAVALLVGWANKKRVISVIVLFLALLLLAKEPFYRAYHVEKPGNRVLETTGMCMVIMGNIVKNCPDFMSREALDFLYSVTPKEVWDEIYVPGNFNDVKWNGINVEVIEEEGLWNILKYTLEAIRVSPMYSLQAFFRLTGMVWRLDGDMYWDFGAWADISKTELVLNAARQSKVMELLNNWHLLIDKGIWKYPMHYIGWLHLGLISFSLAAIRKRRDIWKASVGMPLLCYNFGTALLLTGFDWRFFYMTFPVAIPMIFLVIKMAQRGEEQ